MIRTHLGDFAMSLDAEQRRQLVDEAFLTFGRCVGDQDLANMRFAFERVLERVRQTEPGVGTHNGAELTVGLASFVDEPYLVQQIANPTVLAIAAAALNSEELRFEAGTLHRTRFTAALHYERDQAKAAWRYTLIATGGDPASDATLRDECVVVWIYLNDTTRRDGATQVLPGSAPQVRANVADGREALFGLHEALALAEDTKRGVFAEAPSGGGMAGKPYLLHRPTPNRSGNPCRSISLRYRLASSHPEGPVDLEQLDAAQQQQVRGCLPESAHALLG